MKLSMDIGRFEIVRLLGKSRIGGVYEAVDSVTQERVAVRRLFSSTGDTDTSKWKEAFLTLVNNLTAIEHPALMSIYTAGVDEDGAYMVEEFLEGGRSIEEIVDGGKHLTDGEFYVMANNLLGAFSLIHHHGFSHGYLTGRSVMEVPTSSGGKIYKCTDLGIAGMIPMICQGQSKVTIGDPALTAPEIFENKEPDSRSDVYMLGCLFYLSLAGGHPLAGLPEKEAYAKHKAHKYAPLSGYRSSVPKEIVNWIEHLTQADPDARPQTAAAALELMPPYDYAAHPQSVEAEAEISVEAPAVSSATIQPLANATSAPQLVIKKSNTGLITCLSLVGLVVIILMVIIIYNSFRDKEDAVIGEGNSEASESNRHGGTEQGADQRLEVLRVKDRLAVENPQNVISLQDKERTKMKYSEPSRIISLEEVEGSQLYIDKKSCRAWAIIQDGESISGGDLKITYRTDLGPKRLMKAATGLSLNDGEEKVVSCEGVKTTAKTVLKEELFRYQVPEAEGDVKARIYFKVDNVRIAVGLAISGFSEPTDLENTYEQLSGVYYIDLECLGAKEGDEIILDIRTLGKWEAGAKAEFTPIAVVIADDFPELEQRASTELETGDEANDAKETPDREVAAPKNHFKNGVRVTPQKDGTNKLELRPLN